jgi:hypothetical protein
LLPQAKPPAIREHFIMSPIRAARSLGPSGLRVRVSEDALNFGSSLLGVYSVSISNMRVAIVQRGRHRAATLNGVGSPNWFHRMVLQ